MALPKCYLENNKPCSKHLEEEVQHHFRNGAKACSIINGRILHVTAMQLLAERIVYSEGCE